MWRPGAPLENTLFAILDPYGRPLTRGARSPDFIYSDAHAMASGLREVAMRYPGRGNPQGLPTIANVRLGLDVAAADKKPLTIIVADSESDRRYMEAVLAPLAWSNDLIGKMSFTAGSRNDLRNVHGAGLSRGYIFVLPDTFGTTGTVVAQLPAQATATDLKNALQMTINRYQPEYLDHRDHVRMGRQQGLHWDSATPVTDPHALRAEQSKGRGFGGPPGNQGDFGPPGNQGGFGPPHGRGDFGPPQNRGDFGPHGDQRQFGPPPGQW